MTSTITNADRAKWAASALEEFQSLSGTDYEDSLGDLLCDLMHWASAKNFDFDAALCRARSHYEDENGDFISAAQDALDYLTDHAIDLCGAEEEIVAGIRIRLADAIAKQKRGAI
jgi:hypothetical protein